MTYFSIPLGLLCWCLGADLALCVDVPTQYGAVRGKTVAVDNGRDVVNVDVFRGIPYAKETSGARRFVNPVAPDPWPDVYEALEPREACPQNPRLVNVTNPDWELFGEDCLHMDVYTPNALAAPGTYPVMFYVYGGGYQSGSNVQYPGHFLATHDVVVVVANYRTGPFGFSYTASDACPGNVGLWDQREALLFVRENIASFGGDPDRVTVFGQSSGAGDVGLLLVSPQTKDLFQQAILESGCEMTLWAWNRPESRPETYISQVARDLGCLRPDDGQMMDCLRTKSHEEIVANSSSSCTEGYMCLGMAPVIDGEGLFLPASPKELREEGSVMSGPIISGVTDDDGSFFASFIVPGTFLGCCNRTRFERILRERIVGDLAPRFDEDKLDTIFEALNWHYSQWPYLYENEYNRQAFVKMMTDMFFAAAWDWQIKEHHQVAPTFGYVFDYMSRNSSVPEWAGTPHNADVVYVWGFPMLQHNEHIRQETGFTETNYNDEDVTMSLYVQELFTNFAKYGDPTFTDVEKPTGGVTEWPTFDEVDYATIYISREETGPVYEYRQRDYGFWQDYMRYVMYDVPSGEEEDSSQGSTSEPVSIPIDIDLGRILDLSYGILTAEDFAGTLNDEEETEDWWLS